MVSVKTNTSNTDDPNFRDITWITETVVEGTYSFDIALQFEFPNGLSYSFPVHVGEYEIKGKLFSSNKKVFFIIPIQSEMWFIGKCDLFSH